MNGWHMALIAVSTVLTSLGTTLPEPYRQIATGLAAAVTAVIGICMPQPGSTPPPPTTTK